MNIPIQLAVHYRYQNIYANIWGMHATVLSVDFSGGGLLMELQFVERYT